MTTLAITVEILPSASIHDAATDLCALANRLGIEVHSEFNSTSVSARPGQTPESVVSWWDESRRRDGKADQA